jgi:hypothetical protein
MRSLYHRLTKFIVPVVSHSLVPRFDSMSQDESNARNNQEVATNHVSVEFFLTAIEIAGLANLPSSLTEFAFTRLTGTVTWPG